MNGPREMHTGVGALLTAAPFQTLPPERDSVILWPSLPRTVLVNAQGPHVIISSIPSAQKSIPVWTIGRWALWAIAEHPSLPAPETLVRFFRGAGSRTQNSERKLGAQGGLVLSFLASGIVPAMVLETNLEGN